LGVEGGLPYGTLDESGIPPDFFSDVHVRRGFAYCVDYQALIDEVWLSEAVQPTSPLIDGLAPDFRNPDQPVYSFDLAAAEAEFRQAFGGQLWETGFTTGIAYNTGNVARQTVCEMLKTGIEQLNPKFHIDISSVDWGGTYIPQLVTFQLNMFIIGWGADYPDAHNFMYTFMGTYGDFSYFQRIVYDPDITGDTVTGPGGEQLFGNEYVDALLAEGIALAGVDDVKRNEVYLELQEIYFDQCGSVCLYDVWARR
jgi:peptide/nickel transport system substrate-binding protein